MKIEMTWKGSFDCKFDCS